MQVTLTTKTEEVPGALVELAWQPVHPEAPRAPSPWTGYIPRSTFVRSYEEYTPNSTKSHREWKNFEHFKTGAEGSFTSGADGILITNARAARTDGCAQAQLKDPYVGYQSVYAFGEPGWLDMGLPAFHLRRQDGGFVPPPDDLDALVRRSLSIFTPGMKSNLSLINSIIELKDFKPSKNTVAKVKELFKNPSWSSSIKTGLKAFFKELRKHPTSTVATSAASSYLQAQFAILPLISDICAIYSALASYEKRLNALITKAGRPQRMHFAFNWQEHAESKGEHSLWKAVNWYDQTLQSEVRFFRQVFPKPSQFHAQIEFNISFTQYQREHARVLGLLDALGVNLNPAIIWNALPWSFVLDWVIGVGRWLDELKTSNLEPQINIRRYLWSIRRERFISLSRTLVSATEYGIPDSPTVSRTSTLPGVTQVSYRRSVGLPSYDSLVTSGLSPKEFSLGAALVISSRRRHKRPRPK